jgi:hypothetical protein
MEPELGTGLAVVSSIYSCNLCGENDPLVATLWSAAIILAGSAPARRRRPRDVGTEAGTASMAEHHILAPGSGQLKAGGRRHCSRTWPCLARLLQYLLKDSIAIEAKRIPVVPPSEALMWTIEEFCALHRLSGTPVLAPT